MPLTLFKFSTVFFPDRNEVKEYFTRVLPLAQENMFRTTRQINQAAPGDPIIFFYQNYAVASAKFATLNLDSNNEECPYGHILSDLKYYGFDQNNMTNFIPRFLHALRYLRENNPEENITKRQLLDVIDMLIPIEQIMG